MKTYSFQDVAVIIAAPPRVAAHQVTHWGEGDDALMVARRNDSGTDKMGADGKMGLSISADRSGEITLKLMQTSPTNKVLNDIHTLQQMGPRYFIPINVTFQDLSRLDHAVALTGYIKKLPDVKRGVGMNEQEWVIVAQDVEMLLGDPTYLGFATALSEAT